MSQDTRTLLVLDASPRSARSHSRKVSSAYVDAWREAHPHGKIITRDLAIEPPPFVSEAWVVGAYAPVETQPVAARDAIAVSNRYIDELFAADDVLIATPMYNLNVPAALKAWIDQVVRAGRTFAVGPNGYQGLAGNRRVKVVVASGGDFRPGTPGAAYDFLSPYLRGILGFIGITDVEFVYLHSQTDGNPQREPSLIAAQSTVRQLAAA
ncbi:MAG TPA: NAD(P)H-dependent oxidoreductase [Opitutaceae bacterium]|nr:NAD(P)H-dependent oxidoreductase [Opitutaceae bacterium]